MRKSLKKVLVGVLLLSQIFSQIPVFASDVNNDRLEHTARRFSA